MIGTLFSAILAILLWFNPHIVDSTPGIITRAMMISTSLIFLILLPVGLMCSWIPLQKAEQNSTPRILDMFHKDTFIHILTGWLIVFSLTTFVLASDLIYPSIAQYQWFFPVWIVLFGLSIDASVGFFKRILAYVNPFSIVKMFSRQAAKSIQNGREIELCDSIDALAEVAIKGIQKHSTSICHAALTEEQQIIKQFLLASKSIAHVDQDAQTKALGIVDKVSYTLFYLYQRLDIIFDKALKNQLEPTCSFIITLLGKTALEAAKYDVSLASAPLRFIGKFAKKAQEHGFEETTITSSCVLLEVAKEMIADIDLTYYEIKDPFLSIVYGLEMLSKEAFRRDKTINLALLMQPFKDLRALFENEKIKNHQDAPIIVQNIDRVLGEYEALLVVMNTIPPIPKLEEEPEKK